MEGAIGILTSATNICLPQSILYTQEEEQILIGGDLLRVWLVMLRTLVLQMPAQLKAFLVVCNSH